MAPPVFDTRAPTTTSGNPDSCMPGAIAMESSSVNSAGRSFTCLRRIASGMRGPAAARAKMNTVSSGEALARSDAASSTLPDTFAIGRRRLVGSAERRLRFGDAALHGTRELRTRGACGQQALPQLDRLAVVLRLEGGGTQQGERLRVLRIDRERAPGHFDRLGTDRATAGDGKRFGEIGLRFGILGFSRAARPRASAASAGLPSAR